MDLSVLLRPIQDVGGVVVCVLFWNSGVYVCELYGIWLCCWSVSFGLVELGIFGVILLFDVVFVS